MQKGNIGVTTDNIFPIIKKFLYSDHEIFLRELVSNAVDATQKLKTLAAVGEFKGELGDLQVSVDVDKKAGTITITDRGIGMTAEEIEKYINQIAFSGAEEFVEKYEKDAHAIIGHFGLGFYSSFMVAKQVDILTLSHKEGAQAVKWSCLGDPNFTLEEIEKEDRGTSIVLHIDDENKDFLKETKIKELLTKYCKFLPVDIAFGKKKEWKDGKEVELEEAHIINDTNPAWTKRPADLKEEDYNEFYRKLYPMSEDPLFNIHLNVDHPFTLTGILYFPKIKNNIEVQRNKIQLYCNQVFVTDSVEGIVPEFLTLLHGVLDSPDIPLNVSRSYLQSDSNVKKISNHITKKVADRLFEIFKADRTAFEKKWDDLKLFITYGMLTEEKFYDRAKKFALLKNTEGQFFTYEEYADLVKANQTDKDDSVVYLYASDAVGQYSFIEAAKNKGYDVLLMDGQLDSHFVNHLEQKLEKTRFVRVDSDVAEKLIPQKDDLTSTLSVDQKTWIREAFTGVLPTMEKMSFTAITEPLQPEANPVTITQNEFMRRMKDMSAMQGGGMNFYGEMPDSYSIVVNENNPKVADILKDLEGKHEAELNTLQAEEAELQVKEKELKKAQEGKKDEEVPQADKEALEQVKKELGDLSAKKKKMLHDYAAGNPLIKQMIDLGLLANNMLKGEALTDFVKRSVSLL